MSSDEKTKMMERCAYNLSSTMPKEAINYLQKIPSEIASGIATFRVLKELGNINDEEICTLIENSQWKNIMPLPELQGQIGKLIWDRASEENKEKFHLQQINFLKQKNEFYCVLSQVQIIRNLLSVDRERAFHMLEELEKFMEETPNNDNDWRKDIVSKEMLWAAILEIYARYNFKKVFDLVKHIEVSYEVFAMLAYFSPPEHQHIFLDKFRAYLEKEKDPLVRSAIMLSLCRFVYPKNNEEGKKLRNRAVLEAERVDDSFSRINILYRALIATRSIDESWVQKRMDEIFDLMFKNRFHDPSATDEFIVSLCNMFKEEPVEWSSQVQEKWADWAVKWNSLISNPRLRGQNAEKLLKILPLDELKKYSDDLLTSSLDSEDTFVLLYTRLLSDSLLKNEDVFTKIKDTVEKILL